MNLEVNSLKIKNKESFSSKVMMYLTHHLRGSFVSLR